MVPPEPSHRGQREEQGVSGQTSCCTEQDLSWGEGHSPERGGAVTTTGPGSPSPAAPCSSMPGPVRSSKRRQRSGYRLTRAEEISLRRGRRELCTWAKAGPFLGFSLALPRGWEPRGHDCCLLPGALPHAGGRDTPRRVSSASSCNTPGCGVRPLPRTWGLAPPGEPHLEPFPVPNSIWGWHRVTTGRGRG